MFSPDATKNDLQQLSVRVFAPRGWKHASGQSEAQACDTHAATNHSQFLLISFQENHPSIDHYKREMGALRGRLLSAQRTVRVPVSRPALTKGPAVRSDLGIGNKSLSCASIRYGCAAVALPITYIKHTHSYHSGSKCLNIPFGYLRRVRQ